MACEIQLSSRSAAALLAQIYGPPIGDLSHRGSGHVLDAWAPDGGSYRVPWDAKMLSPQLPAPGAGRVFALADAYIKEFIRLDRLGTNLGGDVAERVSARALRIAAEIGERCPAWPDWPEGWASPAGSENQGTMTPDELLIFGSLLLSASELMGLEAVSDALSDLSEGLLAVSMDEASGDLVAADLGREVEARLYA